jgi:thiamine pyrophosphate-dependent acetolactate synthase large subunit-like protein
MTGNEILARALRRHGVDVLFFLMGGPMIDCENACHELGIRMIDVRMEQAAAMMANAYARVLRRPGVCMAASGPGVVNLLTGVANAFVDGAPVVAVGGSSPVSQYGLGAFQEIDQLTLARPITKWAERCYDGRRIPELVATAFRQAMAGRPGPVYLDMPGDVLYKEVPDEEVRWVDPAGEPPRTAGVPADVDRALTVLAEARRPIVLTGSGIIWSGAHEQLRAFVERAGIPLYTTPQGRGVVPEDHPLSLLTARSTAFREADCILLIGTRLNYVVEYARPPRFSADAKLVQVDVDPSEIGRTRPADAAVVGDARAVLEQFLERDGRLQPTRYAGWVGRLTELDREKRLDADRRLSTAKTPIHPLRLCKEVRDFMDREAVLSVDGQEILNYARQSIPIHAPGHSLNSGPFGTMGVGLPYGLGAKAAKPDAQVIVLHGDGSFGINGLEVDTAARHGLGVIVVVSNNGGWTAQDRFKAGRDLGFGRYHEMAKAFDCEAELVESPDQIRPALERAKASGRPALINVITDPAARAQTAPFAVYST